jgi:hypothetical protein
MGAHLPCNRERIHAIEVRHGKVGQDHVGLEFLKFPPKVDRRFHPMRVTTDATALEFSAYQLNVVRKVFDY